MSITSPCTGTFAPMSGLCRTISAPRMTFCRSLANRPKYSFKFSGSFARSTPNARNPSVSFITVVLQTRQSVWPRMAISLPPLTAQASASERMVLLSGPVMMLPALRSQMNCSSGTPSISGTSRFRRGSMQVNATRGSESENSGVFKVAFAPPATARWFASTMASSRRIRLLPSRRFALGPSDEKVNQSAEEMGEEDDQHPGHFLRPLDAIVRQAVDQHPDPDCEARQADQAAEQKQEDHSQTT